jgi:starch-binding outer membrane protein, SusD/RagB family
MNTIKKIIIAFFSMFLITFQACNDDFMDRFPQTEIGRENFFNTREDLQIYINSLINWENFGWSSGIFIEASDDAHTTGNAEFRTIMQQPTSSSTINGGWDWDRLRSINFFLENFEKANLTQTELDHFEGIARFHRARFYMDKVRRFGDVPWYDKVLSTDDADLFKPRDPRSLVIEKVFEDFEFAAQNVNSSGPVGEVTSWIVKAYIVREALYEGTFRKYHDYLGLTWQPFVEMARDYAQDIMQNGGYALHNTGNPQQDYAALFANTNLVGNPEVIVLNRSIEGERNSDWPPTVFGGYEQSPTRDLVQAYLMADGTFFSTQENWETFTFVEEFQNRDPRIYQTLAYPGWIIYNTGTYATGTAGEPYIQQFNKNFTGYHTIKYFVNNTDPMVHANIDIPVFRYAEILLSYAEAKAELAELTQSDLDRSLNLIRQRAGMPVLSLNPPVDPVQLARYPGIESSTTQWRELLEIRRERRVELTHESRRFTDIMRYKAGKLLEKKPKGLYFPVLGNYDLTGDGHADVKLIGQGDVIPAFDDREKNELGVTLVYYRTGPLNSDATVYLENNTNGAIEVIANMGTFEDPKHYYRPIPQQHVVVNPQLKQIFGWQ